MSSFTEALVLTKGKGKSTEWKVFTSFRYYIGEIGSSDFVDVMAGTTTDLASVPFIRRVFKGDQAAVVHDVLYRRGVYNTKPIYEPEPVTRKHADRIFYEAMLVLGVRKSKAWFYYRSVRMFGWRVWKKHRARQAAE